MTVGLAHIISWWLEQITTGLVNFYHATRAHSRKRWRARDKILRLGESAVASRGVFNGSVPVLSGRVNRDWARAFFGWRLEGGGDAHGHGPYPITNGERTLLSAWLKQGRGWLML
jgi:hypothetical protein